MDPHGQVRARPDSSSPMYQRNTSRDTFQRCSSPEQSAATVSLDALLCGEETGEGDERFVDGLAGDQDVEQEMLDSEARAVIRSAVGALPAPQRRLIERRFFEEISLAKIAEELGLSRQSAYVRQRIILRKLRAALSTAAAGPASESPWLRAAHTGHHG